MKKAMKAALCILSAVTMATGSALSASAGTLSKEELIEKYMPDGAYDIYDHEGPWSNSGLKYYDNDNMEIDVVTYVQGLFDDLQAKMGDMTEEEYQKAQEELAQKVVKICQSADHRAYVYNDYRSGWDHQQWFNNCEYADGFWYVLREDGTVSIVGAEQEYFKGKEILAIPSEIGGAVVKEIEHHAFDSASIYLQDINEIVIPDTVEIIGFGAFNDALIYTNGKINLPNGVKYIGGRAFTGCVSFLADDAKVIHIPESVEFIGVNAFYFWGNHDKDIRLDMPESLVLIEECGFSDPENEKHIFLNGKANYIYMDDVAAYYAKSEAKPVLIAPLAGEVNGDGTIDVADAVMLSRYCAEDTAIALTAEGKINADVNGDGSITLDDVTAIQCIIAKL